MPSFVVDEGVKERAFEFAMFSSIGDMPTMSPALCDVFFCRINGDQE